MRWKNKYITIFVFISLIYVDLFGSERAYCDKLFEHYRIREELKSYNGWSRVCKNNKLNLYTEVDIDKETEVILCSCFVPKKIDRSVNYFGEKEE